MVRGLEENCTVFHGELRLQDEEEHIWMAHSKEPFLSTKKVRLIGETVNKVVSEDSSEKLIEGKTVLYCRDTQRN